MPTVTRNGWPAAALAGLATLLATLAAPAAAQGPEVALLGGTADTGRIGVLMLGPPAARATLYELSEGRRHHLRTVTLGDPFYAPDGRIFGQVGLPSVTPWRCDRRERLFELRVLPAASPALTARARVRTPSCANRLQLDAPTRVRPGDRVIAAVADSWGLGSVAGRLCVKPPGRAGRCKRVRLGRNQSSASRVLRVGKRGRWRIDLRTPFQVIRRRVGVGVRVRQPARRRPGVLLLGDSVMSQLVTPVSDVLGRRIDVDTLIEGGSGLTDARFLWERAAKRRLAAERPRAVAVLLGGADGAPLQTPAGRRVTCCGEPWVAEYARRAGRMMRILARAGRTRVTWVLNPAPASEGMQEVIAAVNAGVRRAGSANPRTTIVDLGTLLSPGFQHVGRITYRGRVIRTHAPDGIHLSLAGAEAAAPLVARALRRR